LVTIKIYGNAAKLLAYKQTNKFHAKIDFRRIGPIVAKCYSGPIPTKFGSIRWYEIHY